MFGSLAGAKYSDGTIDLKMPDVLGNLYRTEERKDRKYGAAGQLLESPQHRYEYDKLGNLKAKYEKKNGQYWLYEWNDTGMLKKVTRPDGKEVVFKYDALGRRIEKMFDGKTTKWVWDGNVPIHEWTINEGESETILNEKNEPELHLPEDKITWIFEEGGFARWARSRETNPSASSPTTSAPQARCTTTGEEKHGSVSWIYTERFDI